MTDEAKMYRKIGRDLAEHGTSVHAAFDYVNLEDRTIHTNPVEGAFSIFRRGMRGAYQHCAEHHLHRYLAAFEFRYNTRTADGFDDRRRGGEALRGIIGKRLTYGGPRKDG
nr:transposase [Parafrankia sp. BMG5.11]